MKTIVLCSGGMDSVTALYDALNNPETHVEGVISFNYGSKHNAKEIPMAAYHASFMGVPHSVIHLPFIGELFKSHLLGKGGAIPDGHYAEDVMKQTVVPFRNGIMLSIAAGLTESLGGEALVIAAHAGDHAIYPDCRETFMEAMGDAIYRGTFAHVRLLRPFIRMTKGQIAKLGHELQVDYAMTWSCYKGAALHCGRCGTCIERREAFHKAGILDPTVYMADAPTLAELIAHDFHLPQPT